MLGTKRVDSPLILIKSERQPQLIVYLSSTSAMGRMTRTFEDAAGRNAQIRSTPGNR